MAEEIAFDGEALRELLIETGAAQGVMEALMHSPNCCGLHEIVVAVLDVFHVKPTQFILNYIGGAYDA